jgi:hypothetical protein
MKESVYKNIAEQIKEKAGIPLEHDIQCAYFEWARNPLTLKRYSKLRWLHAIANGGARHVVVAVKLKREGVLKGVLDVCLPCCSGDGEARYSTLRIEFKRLGGKETKEQIEFAEFCTQEGQYCALCFDSVEAIEITKKYLDGLL